MHSIDPSTPFHSTPRFFIARSMVLTAAWEPLIWPIFVFNQMTILLLKMECSGVEWNGIDGMQWSGVEWSRWNAAQ